MTRTLDGLRLTSWRRSSLQVIAGLAPQRRRERRRRRESGRGALYTACIESLTQRFPHAPEALVYRLGPEVGDEGSHFAKQLLADPTSGGQSRTRTRIREAGTLLFRAKRGELSRRVCAARAELDPTIDVTEILGAQLLAVRRPSEAALSVSSRPTAWIPVGSQEKLLADASRPGGRCG